MVSTHKDIALREEYKNHTNVVVHKIKSKGITIIMKSSVIKITAIICGKVYKILMEV